MHRSQQSVHPVTTQELQDIERSVLGSPTTSATLRQGEGHGHLLAGTAALSLSGGSGVSQVGDSQSLCGRPATLPSVRYSCL